MSFNYIFGHRIMVAKINFKIIRKMYRETKIYQGLLKIKILNKKSS